MLVKLYVVRTRVDTTTYKFNYENYELGRLYLFVIRFI